VRDLCDQAFAVPPKATVQEVKRAMEGQEPISAAVVAEQGRPLGLVMSHHLDRALSSRYGTSLYYNRPIRKIMDDAPLVVEGAQPVEAVARRATSRDRSKIYDHIIVTEEGALAGIVSVQKMLDSLAVVQVEMAKGANPLTGLPGNVAIEQEMDKRSRDGREFSIVYADLDNFKVYNDVYGFKSGDEILRLLARILEWAVRRHGGDGAFLGHVGGDDFVAMVDSARVERFCQAATRCFGRLVRHHYSPEDRERGCIQGLDRGGREQCFPLVSVSLAVVDCAGCFTYDDIARRSAQMKKYAKQIQGNAWVRDRRQPLPEPGAEPPAAQCTGPLRAPEAVAER
jgi:diguanylate cyclase (GGDEF)-like protein